MSDTLQLVVVMPNTQPDRNRSMNVRYASACRRAAEHSTQQERFIGYLLNYFSEVEFREHDDKLKHIGHSLSVPVVLSVTHHDDKLKRIGHSLSIFDGPCVL